MLQRRFITFVRSSENWSYKESKQLYKKPTFKGKPTSMWQLIEYKCIPPTRLARYCCQVLKETGCKNRFIATGVRWDESTARQGRNSFETITRKKQDSTKVSDEIMLLDDNDEKRKLIEHCQLKGKMVVNPIIGWNHADIWEYIRGEGIEYNCLYDCGYKRVGCIGCPMATKGRYKEFADYPEFQRLYIHAFDRMLKRIHEKGIVTKTWKTGEDVFLWWMEDKNIEGQFSMDFDGNDYVGLTEKGM